MTADAIIALRRALRVALVANGPLTARLGGPEIYDEAPRNTTPPYVAFGDVRSRDWSTVSDSGAEHSFAIDVWSQHHGVNEALEIAALVASALETTTPVLAGHRLISMFPQSVESRRENGGRYTRARQIFRAVTEKI